jgi:osmoprotectant transport system ATP-binding protein
MRRLHPGARSSIVISLTGITKIYPNANRAAVDSLSLECEARTLTVLVGESGCGKTTTLKMINRLIEPTKGSISVEGRDALAMDPVSLRRGIGYVFQGIGLFPHRTIAANVGVVPGLLGWPVRKIADQTDELLDLVGLPPADYRERYPRELSGGQQQRVGVARALAANPSVLLMDEPFGAIDPITRDDLRRELVRIQRSLGLTVVLVTHDMTEALLLADKIAFMRNGRLLAFDTPTALVANPPHAYVQTMLEMPKRQAEQVARIISGDEIRPA